MAAEPRPSLLVRQVEQHHDKEVEDQDGARVHDDLHRCQELRAQQQEDARHVQEERQHPEHAVDGIFPRHGQKRARDAGGRHVIEGCGKQGH